MNATLIRLVNEFRQMAPAVRVEVDELPSGVVFIDAFVESRWFVLEFSPSRETGVSENLESTPPFVGHDASFATAEAAADYLLHLVNHALPCAASRAA